MDTPVTRYARSGHVHVAYQTLGDGPLDIVLVNDGWQHLDHQWRFPANARFLRRLASIGRLVVLDKRGSGLSDPLLGGDVPSLEERVDDLRAVMDAAGVRRAALIAHCEGAPIATLFAATRCVSARSRRACRSPVRWTLSARLARPRRGELQAEPGCDAHDGVDQVPEAPVPLTPLDRRTFAAGPAGAFTFDGFDPDGRPQYMSVMARVLRRTS